MKLGELIEELERCYPPQWAMPSDRVGLFCGDLERSVDRVLLAVDPSMKVLEEARDGGFDVVITHHPLTTKTIDGISSAHPVGRKLIFAIRNDIALYAIHTNLDFAPDGVSVALAEILGVEIESRLSTKSSERFFKLVVFVPREKLESLRLALLDTGAGHIGNYSHCSFCAPGEGTFLPLEGANPFIGRLGELEKVGEVRLETVVPQHLLQSAINAIYEHHPYEEPAFDIYPLENDFSLGGFGVVGSFPKLLRLGDVVELCRSKLPTAAVRYVGNPERFVRRAALLGGSGDSLTDNVLKAKVDIFIAGELRHHSALALAEQGIDIVLPGHFATEWVILPRLRETIQKIFEEREQKAEIKISEAEQALFRI